MAKRVAALSMGVGVLVLTSVMVSSAAQEKSVWDGVYTEAQATRGAALYKEKGSRCHGDQLTGNADAPSLVGGEFLGNWNGQPLVSLYDRIRISTENSPPISQSRLLISRQPSPILVSIAARAPSSAPSRLASWPEAAPSLMWVSQPTKPMAPTRGPSARAR